MQVNMNPNQTSPSNTQQPTPVQYSPQFITIPQNMLNFAPGTRFILSPYVPIQYIYPVITYTQNSFPGLQPLIPEPRPQPIQQQQQQIQIPIVPTPIISDEQRSSHFSDELLSNNGDQEQSKIVLESIITHNDDYESESDDYESSVDNDYNNNGNQDDSDNEDSDSSGSSIQFGIEPIEPQNMEIIDTHIKTESQQQTLDLQITDENKQENDQISEQSSPEIIFGKIDKQKQTQSELKETLSEAVIHKPTPALTSVTVQSPLQQIQSVQSISSIQSTQSFFQQIQPIEPIQQSTSIQSASSTQSFFQQIEPIQSQSSLQSLSSTQSFFQQTQPLTQSLSQSHTTSSNNSASISTPIQTPIPLLISDTPPIINTSPVIRENSTEQIVIDNDNIEQIDIDDSEYTMKVADADSFAEIILQNINPNILKALDQIRRNQDKQDSNNKNDSQGMIKNKRLTLEDFIINRKIKIRDLLSSTSTSTKQSSSSSSSYSPSLMSYTPKHNNQYQSIHQQSLPILSVKEKEKEQTNKRNNKQDQPRSSQLYKSELSKSQKKKSKSSIMRDESDFVYVKKNQSPKEVVELPNKASKAWKSRTVNTKEKEIRISEMIGNNQEKQKVNNNNNNNNNQPIQEDEYDKDLITRQCLSFLNRLTSSNIMDLVPEISKRLNSKESIKIFLIEMFEKAVYEKKYVSIYSKLSKILENECRLSDQGDEVFRRTLIELCQMEFEQALEISSMKHQKLTEIQEKHKQDKLQSDDQEQINLTQEYDDEEEDGMQRIRLCGIVSFIASLHIEGLLHPIVIRNCLRDLLKMDISNPIHANIEAFVTFLYKVGRVFDVGSKQKREVDLLLERLRSIQEGGKLTQRLKFMILEVEDERKRGFSFETALGTK